jgi:hypothetical protein
VEAASSTAARTTRSPSDVSSSTDMLEAGTRGVVEVRQEARRAPHAKTPSAAQRAATLAAAVQGEHRPRCLATPAPHEQGPLVACRGTFAGQDAALHRQYPLQRRAAAPRQRSAAACRHKRGRVRRRERDGELRTCRACMERGGVCVWCRGSSLREPEREGNRDAMRKGDGADERRGARERRQ